MNKPETRTAKILGEALKKTDEVQEDLEDAAEALSDTNLVLTSPRAASQAVSVLAGAVRQNVQAEGKVKDATQELEAVKEMLHEAQIAQAAGDATRNSGEGTASILGYFEGRRARQRAEEAKADPKADPKD